MTSGGIDWQREKWQSGLGSKFIHQGEKNAAKRWQSEKLLEVGSADVMERVSLTGKAKRWQLDGKGTESFGTLLEKAEYNRQHEYLTESREKEDVAYLTQLKKEYGLD